MVEGEDHRLGLLQENDFKGKDILDIGCNSGVLTLEIASKFGVKSMLGVDTDTSVVGLAHRNRSRQLHAYMSADVDVLLPLFDVLASKMSEKEKVELRENLEKAVRQNFWPKSLTQLGPCISEKLLLDYLSQHLNCSTKVSSVSVTSSNQPMVNGDETLNLCRQVHGAWVCSFTCANAAALDWDVSAGLYDTVLMLSVSKWIHLNGGDDGIKRVFTNIFYALKPGGVFYFEPQPWASYAKRAKGNSVWKAALANIQLKPVDFPTYLVSDAVGFTSYTVLFEPDDNVKKGYLARPLYRFVK